MVTAVQLGSFSEEDHCYKTVDGIIVPSVTQVIEGCGFVDYSMVNTEVLDRKSKLGMAVHTAAHIITTGDDLDWDTVHEDAVGYILAHEKFMANTGFKAEHVEEARIVVIDGMPVGMKPDADGILPDGTPYVFDLKCALKEEKSWRYQSAAYALGLWKREDKRYKRAMVQLKPTGDFKLFPYTDRRDEQMFVCMLALTHEKINQGISWRKS
jgi:hypothetical protein